MFTDRIKLTLCGGKGGNGIVAWRREPYVPKGGPAGGNGGCGGSIVLRVDNGQYSLDHLRKKRHISAPKGGAGGGARKNGARGQDLVLKIPAGTLVKDVETGRILHDLSQHGEEVTLCEGGKGGLGNAFFKSATRRAPNFATEGKEGVEVNIELELKVIADVGLIGFPNAGKTTLLNALASLRAKTGAYPFTTLAPNLGTIEFDDFSRLTVADIPGLIENAHKGKGLGHTFLKHVERCQTLVFILDAQEENQLEILQNELRCYSPEFLDRPTLIVYNKADIADPPENALGISALTGEGLPHFLETMRQIAQQNGKRFK